MRSPNSLKRFSKPGWFAGAVAVHLLALFTLPAGTGAQTADDPYLGLDSPSVQEGDSGTTTMTFTARLTDPNGRTQAGTKTITAHYEVLSESGNTATAGKDYTAAKGSITFAPGETSKTIDVTVLGDTEVEGDETFTVKWTGWENVWLAHYSKTGTIRNDDEDSPVEPPEEEDDPYLGLDSPSVQEGDSGTTTMTFTARLTDPDGRTQAGTKTITAHYEVLSESGNTATAGKDYTAAKGSITFAPGETSRTIDVTVLGDTEVEGDETLTVKWTGWENVWLVSYTHTGTITNDDRAPAPDPAAVNIADASAVEGDAISFTVTLDKAVPGGFTVTPGFTDGTATKGTDYTENTTALNFSGTAGETQSFSVSTTEDTDVEKNETFTVGLTVSGTTHNVTATSTATGTIRDDDGASVDPVNPATLTLSDAKADEGDAISFTVTLDKAVSGGLTVTPGFTDGTATKARITPRTRPPSTSPARGRDAELQRFDDGRHGRRGERDLHRRPDRFRTTHSVTATSTATGTITDDDTASPATVTIADASADEGDAISFTVTLDQAVAGGLTVTRASPTAPRRRARITPRTRPPSTSPAPRARRRASAFRRRKTLDVEENETFTVGLSVSGTTHSVTATSTATGTITNDDNSPDEGASAPVVAPA